MTPRSRASDRQAVVNVTGTCAQRSRWSRLRALAARASFIGGVGVSAWLCTATVAPAAPVSGPALAQSVEASVAETASAATGTADAGETNEVEIRVMPTVRLEKVRPGKPAAPEAVEPAEPAAPEIAKPDPVEITAPATPVTGNVAVDDDVVAEHTDVPAGLAPAPPPPAAPAPPAAHAFSKSAKSQDKAEDTAGTTSKAQRQHSPEPEEPPEPVAGQDQGQPAPAHVPPAPTMTTAGSATGSGGGPRILAILPTDAWQPRAAAAAVAPRETVPLRGTVSVEPSTSPD